MTEQARPLVTFALFAYNQERYVADAIAAALGQTYSPLEIILSDDCSSDDTFGVMQRAVAMYDGPHKVILNRNSKNLNIGDHVNVVGRLSTGALIVMAAGDDVSMPNRTTQLVNYWLAAGLPTAVLCSDFEPMDAASKQVVLRSEVAYRGMYRIEDMAKGDVRVLGATTAVTRDVFSAFAPLASAVRHEDRVLPFRALLLGGIVAMVDEKLVRYRVEGGISRHHVKTSRDFLYEYTPRINSNTLPDAEQRLTDLEMVLTGARLRTACLATTVHHKALIDLAKMRGLALELALIHWVLNGARPFSLFKHYFKMRFIWFFGIYFRHRYARSVD